MNNFLLWLGGLLVAVLCALFAVPHFVDWTRYRGVFEEEATRVLGRQLRVAGAVNLRLLPTPYVRFEKVRLADAEGQTGEPFFRADDFTLWLAPGPLLRGAIEVRQIELHRPTLKLRLNADGGGNWQSFSIAHRALPFVPSDVALQSVLITDGTISIDGADRQELVRIGAINGDLSAAALEGPFQFKGSVDQEGVRNDVRLSTTAFDADGALKLKLQVSKPANAGSLVLDGTLAGLSGRFRIDGQVTGQAGFHAADIGRPAVAASAVRAAGSLRLPIDLRAALAADATGAKLTDIGLAFEVDGKPQLIGGSAVFGWKGGLVLNSEFNSRWLNLDQTFAEKSGARPIDVARRLATTLALLVPQGVDGTAQVTIDQVTLGGEALSDIKVKIERAREAVRVTELALGMPGGSRATITGTIPQPDAFDGNIALRGANLSRLLNWLGMAAITGESRTDGAYGLTSQISFNAQSMAIKAATATLGNAMLTGSVGYRWGERPRLDVILDGDQIDLGTVTPHALDLTAHIRALTGQPEAKPNPNSAKAAAPPPGPATGTFDLRQHDATLRVRALRLRDATHDLNDVDVDASLINGKLGLQRLRFTSASGLEIDAEGEVADIGARSHGALRGTVAASGPAAVSELLAIVDHADLAPQDRRWQALAPARVAWSMRFGESKTAGGTVAPSELWLDGTLLGRRATLGAQIDGTARQWRQAQVQVKGVIDRPDWQRLRSLVTAETQHAAPALRPAATGTAAVSGPSPARSRLLINLTGRPDQALTSFLKLDDDAFDAGLAGKIRIDADAIGDAEGELQIRTADFGQSLSILGFTSANVPAVALEGTADVAVKGGTLRIVPSTLEVAGTAVGGEIAVTRVREANRHRIEGKVTATAVAIPRLVDLFVAARSSTAKDGEASVWNAAPFDLGLLDRLEGRLRLEATELSLTNDVSLSAAVVDSEFGPGKLDVTSLEGNALGARLASRWTLQKAQAGVTFNGTAKLAEANLDRLGGDSGKAALGGRINLNATISGRGLSPRGLVTALTGSGEIDLAGGQIGQLSLASLRALSNEIIDGKREPTVETLEKGVATMLADKRPEQRLALGNRKLTFDVADGVVKLRAFSIETADGRATNRSTIDLSRLMIDSEWKLDQRNPATGKDKDGNDRKAANVLPAATIVFVGTLGSLGRLEPAISVEALARELAVRRMERDVEKLEELRRADEERARLEAERLKAEAAARAEAAAAAAARAAASATAPGATLSPAASDPPLPPAASLPVGEAAASAPLPAIPVAGAPPATNAAQDGAAATVPTPVAEPKRRPSVSSEQRQVPSSQSYKGQSIQDVFRRQGGN